MQISYANQNIGREIPYIKLSLQAVNMKLKFELTRYTERKIENAFGNFQ